MWRRSYTRQFGGVTRRAGSPEVQALGGQTGIGPSEGLWVQVGRLDVTAPHSEAEPSVTAALPKAGDNG